MTSPADPRIEVPDDLVSWHRKFFDESGTQLSALNRLRVSRLPYRIRVGLA